MNNQYISTTQLREQSSKVVSKLKLGEEMLLVHRSNIIGIIKPLTKIVKKITDLAKFERVLEASRPKRLIPRHMRDAVYRMNLQKKYG